MTPSSCGRSGRPASGSSCAPAPRQPDGVRLVIWGNADPPLRDYTRTRIDLTRDRTRYYQRLEKLLEDALIKVSAVASKTAGFVALLQLILVAFAGRTLFEDASLQVNRGDRVGLVGPNGAGKSTLFSLILGEASPDEGKVSLERAATIGGIEQGSHTLRWRAFPPPRRLRPPGGIDLQGNRAHDVRR